MVLYSVSSLLSLRLAVSGIFISFVRMSMLGLWVGIELNFLGAICYIRGTSIDEGERRIKYFVVQVLGSCFLVIGFLISVNSFFRRIVLNIIILGVILKLGLFPFHFWVPAVISGLSWIGCFIVSTLQKAVPFWLLRNACLTPFKLGVIEILACVTRLVGCLGGLGVLSYRVLLGYSSLVNLGVITILCCINQFIFYFIVYRLLNLFVMFSLYKIRVFSFIDLIKDSIKRRLDVIIWISLYFFSLAGLPPFSGSVLKVNFLLNCWNFFPLGCVVCVLSSAISLYFYTRVVLALFIFWGKRSSKENIFNLIRFSWLRILRFIVNIAVGLIFFLSQGL